MNANICRCCLMENPPLVYDIFEQFGSMQKELRECLPAEVEFAIGDELPRVICSFCCTRIHELLDFRRRCLESDRELRRRCSEIKNKAVEDVLGLIEQLREQDVQGLQPTHLTTSPLPYKDDLDGENVAEILNELANVLDFDQNSVVTSPLPNTVENNSHLITSANVNVGATGSNSNQLRQFLARKDNWPGKNTKSNQFQCSECDKSFTRNFQLKLHLMSVHQLGEGIQYKCDICLKNFASLHSLSYHRKSLHSAERPFVCTHCQRQFILRSQLTSHMRMHTGETKPRIYNCSKCEKRWPTKSDLKTHMRSHNPQPERPFKCDQCTKSFLTRGHLTSHGLVHSGEKPFACEFCERTYQSIGNLNNHMIRRHINEVEYKLKEIENAQSQLMES